MTSIFLSKFWRVGQDDSAEEVDLFRGGNLLVGPPNAGKTKLMKSIDYCLGGRDSAGKALGADIVQRYRDLGVTLMIGDEQWRVERKLHHPGLLTKVLVNGTALGVEEFSSLLLERLDIPQFHFAKGRQSIQVSWRMLFANMSRREKTWTDFAQGQYMAELHASLISFLGLGRAMMASQSNETSELRDRLRTLESRREQFAGMLQQVAYRVLTLDEIAIGVTDASLSLARERLEANRLALDVRRQELMQGAQQASESGTSASVLASLADTRNALALSLEQLERARARTGELAAYLKDLNNERDRWGRAIVAGDLLTHARVQQCPVCDQPVQAPSSPAHCFLCQRLYPADTADQARMRVDFERAQLDEERKEAVELLSEGQRVERTVDQRAAGLRAEAARIEALIRPQLQAATAALPPEASIVEQQIGRTDELLEQIERLRTIQDSRDDLDREITETRSALSKATASAQIASGATPFAEAGSALEDGMNSYLGRLGPERWTKPPVSVRLRESDFEIFVGDEVWATALGATLACYLTAAYHYALLGLCAEERFRFPGLVLLDFPATLGDLAEGAENYIVQPFIDLAKAPGMPPVQVIAAGRALNLSLPTHRLAGP